MIEWLRISMVDQTVLDVVLGMLLPIFSVLGVFLSTSLNATVRRTGFVLGLLSQPVWFYFAISTYNVGMFINAMFFTGLWLFRFYQTKGVGIT